MSIPIGRARPDLSPAVGATLDDTMSTRTKSESERIPRRDLLSAAVMLPAALGAGESAPDASLQHLNPPTLSTPRGYSHAVVATGGKTVYISGQVSVDKSGALVGAGNLK